MLSRPDSDSGLARQPPASAASARSRFRPTARWRRVPAAYRYAFTERSGAARDQLPEQAQPVESAGAEPDAECGRVCAS